MMAPVAERHLPDPARVASVGWTTSRGLCLSPPFQSQHRRSTEAVFSRIGPKPPLRPRGRIIPAWIHSQAPIARALCGCPTSMGDLTT